MAKSTEIANILLVSKNQAVIDDTHAAFSNELFLKLVEKSVTPGNLFDVIEDTKPDVILFDFAFQQRPFYLVDKIASEYPMCGVVAVLSESQLADLDRVILAGARAFVHYPYQREKLVSTIQRVVELLEREKTEAAQAPATVVEVNPVHTFTVFSPKGGVGTTTVATNLAISLHKALKEDVLLIDGKHLFGHVALYLNLRTGNSIKDLIAHSGMLDQRLIKQVVVQHTSGIHVLPSPNSISDAQGIRPDDLFKVIQALQQVYPNIIIDGGSSLNENTVTYMDSSGKILVVLTPDLASMRDVRQFMDVAATLSYPKEKILFILNQAGRKADVKLEEIEDILKMQMFGKVPADGNLALSSLNEGVPILIKKSRHPISKAYRDISKDLVKIIKTSET